MRFTCPACGFYLDYANDCDAPTHGFVDCEECGFKIEVNPMPLPASSTSLAGATEIEEGAAVVRKLVEKMRRR